MDIAASFPSRAGLPPSAPQRPPPRQPTKSSEEDRIAAGRLPDLVEQEETMSHPNGVGHISSGSDEDSVYPSSTAFEPEATSLDYTPSSTTSGYTPSTGFSSGFSSWNSMPQRPRGGSGNATDAQFISDLQPITTDLRQPPQQRPGAPLRTPSSTYAPPRRPPQFLTLSQRRMHSSASVSTRSLRRDPNAQYRAQEKAYVQRVRQQPQEWLEGDLQTPAYSTDEETDDESPSTDAAFENDPYDPETQLFFGNEDNNQPTEEELQNPANRERLEWHSMLASVLKGDVVKQEKQRLIGTSDQKSKAEINNEIWTGVRAKTYGRGIPMQKKMIEDARSAIAPLIEEVIGFEIKGETEVGKTAVEQVQDVVFKIEKCESLYCTRRTFETAQPRASSDAFRGSCDAVISWHNTTELINTELGVLQAWVGNTELDFQKQKKRSGAGGELADESSFIDRILKEDGLKSLQGDKSMFTGIGTVIEKAKATLIENAQSFAERHLPPYIEELLTLINFPSRLIQEIIRMRLSYAKKMKESAQQSILIIDQMISQFQILMRLACRIKGEYLDISQPEPGWDLPPCIDEAFDSVILDALKFYFKMLNWKLGANKNTFREAEILEQEWDFSNEIGRQLDGGDIEVAEQFSSLTAKSLLRLTLHFEKELQSKPDESALEMEKRYKSILDSVRVRQRKLFRFSRILRQRFENATEFNFGQLTAAEAHVFYDALIATGHFMISTGAATPKGVYFFGSTSLWERPKEIQSILGTSFHAEDTPEDPLSPYILIIKPEDTIIWEGPVMDIDTFEMSSDLRLGRLRLVADGSQNRLLSARLTFLAAVHGSLEKDLVIAIEQRANLYKVNTELGKIKKTTFKLSNTIMESVEVIRSQNKCVASPDLIQSCFAFATEFGLRSLTYMDASRRQNNNNKLTDLALDWISFICDDCDAADRRTFKWAVVALEFAMNMTRGQNIINIGEDQYTRIRVKVAGCMSVLISHFDIMGARSTLAAQQEKNRLDATSNFRLNFSQMNNDDEAQALVTEQRMWQLEQIDAVRKEKETTKANLGRVLEGSNEADRSLTFLSSSATNVTMRWQQGQFVGGGSFGSVYAAINLDTGSLMAVKEIRLQDPQLIPTIVKQIGDEMGVLAVLDHPNIVSYYGIEVHRDKVYIFMEYCSGGSVAGLLEHGRIEDETVIMVYALQMLEGLAYLHQANIVHRDIKPENVLLDHNGVIKYVDFGAAKIIARQGQTIVAPSSTPDPPHKADWPNSGDGKGANPPRGQTQKTMTGTPMYMSPEVIRGDSPATANGKFSGAADIWSLGCVILEMATGRRPWAALDNEWAIMYNIAQGNPPEMPTSEQLSECGIDFLKRCFDRDPNRRSSAAELLQHEWIVEIRKMVVEPETPLSSTSSSSGGGPSRHNSSTF
jgi:mitogen-activated protein kinase kinase kinase